MRLEIHDEAAVEIQRHHAWYESRNPRVAARLADLFEAAVVQIARNPLQFPLMEMAKDPGTIRRVRLKRFPLYVLYCVGDNVVTIIAVPHTSQRSEYWRSRISG